MPFLIFDLMCTDAIVDGVCFFFFSSTWPFFFFFFFSDNDVLFANDPYKPKARASDCYS